MEIVLICLVSLGASLLTFYSGFGLGTLLLPAFAVFYEVQVAVMLTAIVHFLNNLFKAGLVYKYAMRRIALKFSLFAIPAGLLGAYVLGYLEYFSQDSDFTYVLNGHVFEVTIVNVILGALMIVFGVLELSRKVKDAAFDLKWLPLGALLSGFFGGLSGHQGAIRSAFLIRANLSREAYVATGVLIACAIDLTRLPYYLWISGRQELPWSVLGLAVMSAFTGVWIGNRYLHKVSISWIQYSVAFLLITTGALLMLGML